MAAYEIIFRRHVCIVELRPDFMWLHLSGRLNTDDRSLSYVEVVHFSV